MRSANKLHRWCQNTVKTDILLYDKKDSWGQEMLECLYTTQKGKYVTSAEMYVYPDEQ